MASFQILFLNWRADVIISDSTNDWIHLQAHVLADDAEWARFGAEWILKTFALGRTAVIRSKPEQMSETDFDTKIVHHKGYVRFSYKLEIGDWHFPDSSMTIGFGELMS